MTTDTTRDALREIANEVRALATKKDVLLRVNRAASISDRLLALATPPAAPAVEHTKKCASRLRFSPTDYCACDCGATPTPAAPDLAAQVDRSDRKTFPVGYDSHLHGLVTDNVASALLCCGISHLPEGVLDTIASEIVRGYRPATTPAAQPQASNPQEQPAGCGDAGGAVDALRPSPEWYRRKIMEGPDIDPIAGPLPTFYVCSNPQRRHRHGADPMGHCPECLREGVGNWSCTPEAAPDAGGAVAWFVFTEGGDVPLVTFNYRALGERSSRHPRNAMIPVVATSPSASSTAGEAVACEHNWCNYVTPEYKKPPPFDLSESPVARYIDLGFMCDKCGATKPREAVDRTGLQIADLPHVWRRERVQQLNEQAQRELVENNDLHMNNWCSGVARGWSDAADALEKHMDACFLQPPNDVNLAWAAGWRHGRNTTPSASSSACDYEGDLVLDDDGQPRCPKCGAGLMLACQASASSSAAAGAVDGWQPMEAAPLDGTIIVCRYAHHPARPAMFDGEAWVTWGAVTESGPEPIGWRALTTQREDRADG